MGLVEDAIAERDRRDLVARAVAERDRRAGVAVAEPPAADSLPKPGFPGQPPRDIRIPRQHAISTAEEVKLAIKETPQNLKIGTIGLTASVFEAIKRRAVQIFGGGILPDETVLSQFEAVSPTARVGRSQLVEIGKEPAPETEEELFERVNLFKTGQVRLPGAVAAQAAGVATKLPDITARAIREKQRRESEKQDTLTLKDAPIVTLNRLVQQSGVPSMAAAVGVSLLTGDPLIGLVLLGESEGGAAFQEQLEAGGSVRKALIIAELSEAAEIGGEMLVLPKIVGGLKTGLSIRRGLALIGENATQEGVTGFNQRFLEVFGKETTKGTSKILAAKIAFVEGVKAIPENAFVGGVVAGGTSTAGTIIRQVAGAVESDVAAEQAAPDVGATLAGLQARVEAETVAKGKVAARTPLDPTERQQFPELATQEDQIAKLREGGVTDQPVLEIQKATPAAIAEQAKPPREAPRIAPKAAEKPKGVAAKAIDNVALLRERAEIKKLGPKKRSPEQITRLDAIETELVEENADEFPDIDITPETRNAEVKKANTQIKEHGIYEAELASLEDIPDVPTQVNVDKTEIGDVRARFEGRPEMLRRFKQQEAGGARWDQAASELGLTTLDEYMDAVELAVESKKPLKGGINEVALANALNSGDPAIELFALKREMLKQGFNAAEINKEINEFAARENIPQDALNAELISLEELSDVAKKQRILRELDKTVRKVAKKQSVQDQALKKARQRAIREKRPVFVIERTGRPVITIREPRTGTFTKITPPAEGETVGTTETITAEPKPKGKPKPTPQTKEQKLLIQRINLEVKKKGLTQTLFSDLKLKHGGSRRLTGRTPRTAEQLQAVLKAVQRARPKVIGHKKVLSLKTEKQIAELKGNLTNLGFMNDEEFAKILSIEARGKQPKFIDARNFITQKQANDILLRMHDTAQRLRVTESVDRAVAGNAEIQAMINKIAQQPQRRKDPGRLRSMRFFFQRLGVQANEPIYDVFLDLTLAADAKSRERHDAMKLAEKLPDFTKIATDPKALQRVEDWIVSQSNLQNKPATPTDITENELRLAKLVQASFKSYETLARAGKFFEFFDKRTELPQYLQFKKGIDTAFDVYNTKGYDALIKYLDTQDWGIVRAGYSPMESVVRKVSTNRMPDIAVGKGRIKTRGIQYQKQDRDILQRWYSYMRQMDQLIHIQPRIKSLVRLINDNQQSFINPARINSSVSTYLDNLKHTNYEDGLIEEVVRRLYSQAITVRVLADPIKPLRNLLQNAAFSEDRRDFIDPRNKKLTAEDTRYLETFVQQSSVMMSDWAFTGEQPFDFFWIRRGIKKLTDKDLPTVTKWVQRKTLYPQSDRLNRLISFTAKINRVRRAFVKDQPLAKQMRDARFSDMQKEEQRVALGILAKDGVDDMARYIAKVHTDNTHFLYAREQRSPAEQTKLGRIALNLALFKRAALEKAALQTEKIVERGTGPRAKLRAANVLMMLIAMSALVGILWKKMTGQKYSPYSYLSFLELNFGGLATATIEKVESVYNSMLAIITLDPKKAGKAIDDFGTDIAGAADYLIPFYDLGLRAIEATIGSENIDRVPARKLRELIDKEYKTRGLAEIDRDLIEKMQFTFAKGGKPEPADKSVTKKRTGFSK